MSDQSNGLDFNSTGVDKLFDMFKVEEQTTKGIREKANMAALIHALEETGLRMDDPRLKELKDNIKCELISVKNFKFLTPIIIQLFKNTN